MFNILIYLKYFKSFDGDQESADPIELELLTKTSLTHETRILSDHNLLTTNPGKIHLPNRWFMMYDSYDMQDKNVAKLN